MNEQNIKQLINQGENQRVELKKSLSLRNEIGATISAFANTEDGTIDWEGAQEVTYAYDDYLEKTITFRAVVEETARRLISLFPKS